MSRRTTVMLTGSALVLALGGPATASHDGEAHLPLRDRGARAGRPRSCNGVLLETTERSKSLLWYSRRAAATPRRAATFPSGVTAVSAAVAPNGRTVAVAVESAEDRVRLGMAAFSRMRFPSSGTQQVVIMDLPVRGRRDVVARFAGSAPAWSHDGRRIAFERGDAVLVTSFVAWGRAEFVAWGWDPAWSPVGNVLALAQGDRRHSAIHLLTPGGSTRLTYDGRIDENPVWSPVGRRIVFTRRKRPGGWPDLWIVAADGGRDHRLTHFNHYNGASPPLWSSDGRHVAFTMANSETQGLRILNLATRRITAPSHPRKVHGILGPFSAAAAWRPSRVLLYETGIDRRALWQYSLRERRAAQVLPPLPSLDVLDVGLCGAPPRR